MDASAGTGKAVVGVNLKLRGGSSGVNNGNTTNNNNQTVVKKPRARQALGYANIVAGIGRVGSGASSRSGSGGSNSGGIIIMVGRVVLMRGRE